MEGISWWRKWQRRLWPVRYCEFSGDPGFAIDGVVYVRLVANLGLADRLRVLWSGCLVVEVNTLVDRRPGMTRSVMVCYPVPSEEAR